MKHLTYLLLLLAVFVTTACTPTAVQQTSEVSPTEVLPTATLPPATLTATVTPTEVPISSLPVEELVQKFMAGDVEDISSLSVEQRMRFSQAYVEALNQQRGIHPAIYNNEAYLSSENFTMLKLTDGSTKQKQTIELYMPAYKDEEGFTHIQTPDGQWIKINNSQGVDWNMIVDDPNDPRINWPTSTSGQSKPQWLLSLNESGKEGAAIIKPIILLDPVIGEIFLENDYGKMVQNIQILDVNQTDSVGNPLSVRLSLLIPSGEFGIYEEGADQKSMKVMGADLVDYSKLWQEIKNNPNKVYYLIVNINQPAILSMKWGINANNWSGLMLGDESFVNFRDGIEVNDLLVLLGVGLISKD